jgi:hypothetical protein
MDSIQIILAALRTGVDESARGNPEIARSFDELKALVVSHFGDNAKAVRALEDFAGDPETYERPLAKALSESGADRSDDVLAAARRLLQIDLPPDFDVLRQIGAREEIRTGDRFTRMAESVSGLKAQQEATSRQRMEEYWEAEYRRRAEVAERLTRQKRQERQLLIGVLILAVVIVAVFIAISIATAGR